MKQHLRQKNYPMAFIGNMDKTPVYFDLVPNKVVDRVGVKSCIIRTTGAEKRHITVALTVTANGEMLPPFIIFKGKRQPKLQVCGWWFFLIKITILLCTCDDTVIQCTVIIFHVVHAGA